MRYMITPGGSCLSETDRKLPCRGPRPQSVCSFEAEKVSGLKYLPKSNASFDQLAVPVQEFYRQFMALEGRLLSESKMSNVATLKVACSILSEPERLGDVMKSKAYLHAGLEVVFTTDTGRYLFCHFFARLDPQTKSKPVIMNTVVSAQNATDLYGAVLETLRQCLPQGARLLTFVRQDDSLKTLLEKGIAIEFASLQLVQLFNSGGWDCDSISYIPAATTTRQFFIKFSSARD